MDAIGAGENLLIAHPKTAAELITRHVTELAGGLAQYGALNRPPTDVSPQPCDQVERTVDLRHSIDSEADTYADPWYVNYSPYTMMFIGYVDTQNALAFSDIAAKLSKYLTALGWRAHEAVLQSGSSGEPRLVIESPTPGYGARIVHVSTASAALRIGIFVSSPCLQHPDAITT